MSWNAPMNVDEMSQSIRNGWAWQCRSKQLAGDYVAVLSSPRLDSEHELSAHVLEGAKRYREHYLSTRGPDARTPDPETVLYYVRDTRTNRVLLARQADGKVLDELDTIRPDLRPDTREAMREAIRGVMSTGG